MIIAGLLTKLKSFFVVPDDVLINTFDFYVVNLRENRRIEGWQMLTHVGRRWTREASFLNHHFASICNLFVNPKHVRGTSGRLCLSSFTASSMTNHQVWKTSSLHSSTTIACCKSYKFRI